jgi:hypothetical protein
VPTATPTVQATDIQPSLAGLVEALALDNLSTRSGPGTDYRETGTYPLKGQTVALRSLAYDEDGVAWVQCDVRQGNLIRRVYTGLKRFDEATIDLSSLPTESAAGRQAKVSDDAQALYGPGEGYGAYAGLTVNQGQTVTRLAQEGEYAHVEWATEAQTYRAWVPNEILNLL